MVTWSAPIYLASAFVIWYMSYMVYRANKESEGNFYLSLVGFCGGLWAFTQGLRWSIPGKISLLPYYLNYVAMIFIAYSVLMLVLSFPVKFRLMKNKYVPYILIIPQIIMVVALITDPLHHSFFKTIHPIETYPETWAGEWGPFGLYFYVGISMGYVFTAFLIIMYRLLFTKNLTVADRKILLLFVELMVIVLTPTLILYVFPIVRLPEPNPVLVIMAMVASIRAYMVLTRYSFLSFDYVQEAETEKLIKYEPGKNYVVKERETAYRMFREFASQTPGLVVSAKFPTWVRVNFDIMKSPIVWITETEYKSSINPERIEFEITYTMIDFYRQNPQGILLLDGISYLTAYNNFEKTYKLIKDVSDMASATGGTFILAYHDANFLSERERRMIEILFDDSVDERIYTQIEEAWVYLLYSDERDRIKYAPTYTSKFFAVTTKNPRGMKNALWVSSVGDIKPEKLPFEGLEIISEKIKNGYDIVFDGPEILTNYIDEIELIKFLKYLADLCTKYDRKLILLTSKSTLNRKIGAWLESFADYIESL